MIAKTLVFVCAAIGLVAGSCYEIRAPQEYSQQVISVPVQAVASYSPVLSENVFSTGSSDSSSSGTTQVVATPVVSENVYSSGSSLPVVVTEQPSPVVQVTGSELLSSGSSVSSLSQLFSGSSSGSFGVEASNGPESSPVSIFQAPSVTLPPVEGPVVTLSSQSIPAPRVLSQRCICTKTVVKPQVIQRTVTVPRIQRYLKRTVTPVVENISYKSNPITQESSGSSSYVLSDSGSSGSGSSSGSYVLSGSGSSGSSVVLSGSGYPSSSPVVLSSGSSQSRYVSTPVVVSSGSSYQRLY